MIPSSNPMAPPAGSLTGICRLCSVEHLGLQLGDVVELAVPHLRQAEIRELQDKMVSDVVELLVTHLIKERRQGCVRCGIIHSHKLETRAKLKTGGEEGVRCGSIHSTTS